MAERTGDTAPTIAVEPSGLTRAKFAVPQQRQGSVSRAPLVDAARTSSRRFVGVTAPAGYGKSTLLSEWARVEDRLVGWVALDRFDDDPVVLVQVLASAFALLAPDSARLVAGIWGPGMSVLGRSAPRLAGAFAATPRPFVLMVDDVHELASPAAQDVLGIVLNGIPLGSQAVTASRSEQAHVGRSRAAGDAFEVRATDLALDASGAEKIFSETQAVLPPGMAAQVIERTEGWPVGLQLAALIARDNPTATLEVSGDDRYVADYLYREALANQPVRVQQFLRRTAVLDQLSGPSCDALLGEPGSQALLVELEMANLFLVPLDRRREWYRFHGLFREFLLSELNRVEPGARADLERRAADWYESEGSPELAIEHLLNTPDRERCVRLVTELVLPTYQAGQVATVERWLSTLGRPAVDGYPPLAVLATWIAALTGRVVETERLTAVIATMTYQDASPDGAASFESARAMVRAAMCAAGPEQMKVDADLAVAQEPTWSPWRDTALYLLGEAHLLADDESAARAAFSEAADLARVNNNADNLILSESELALLAGAAGDWSAAEAHVARALEAVESHQMQEYLTSVIAFVASARVALHRGDRETATTSVTQAMRARADLNATVPFLAVRVRLQLARTLGALGDASAAQHLLKEADDVLMVRPALGALVMGISELRAALAQSGRGSSAGPPPLTPAEMRLLPYLQTHLTIAEIGERLFVSRNTVSTEVGSIYRKLGVSSRSEAVRQATALGMLGA